MADYEELDRIVTELEGYKAGEPGFSAALKKLSTWTRKWCAETSHTIGCNKCGERWPKGYTHYFHVCLMESHLTEESNHKEEKLDMVCSHESDGTVTDVSALRNRDISQHDARTYQLRCKKCDEYYSLPKDSHLKDNSNDN